MGCRDTPFQTNLLLVVTQIVTQGLSGGARTIANVLIGLVAEVRSGQSPAPLFVQPNHPRLRNRSRHALTLIK